MLSLRSLAFILASAMRRARDLSSASFNHLPDRKNGRQMDIKAPAKMAMKIPVSFMSLPCEQFIPRTYFACPVTVPPFSQVCCCPFFWEALGNYFCTESGREVAVRQSMNLAFTIQPFPSHRATAGLKSSSDAGYNLSLRCRAKRRRAFVPSIPSF